MITYISKRQSDSANFQGFHFRETLQIRKNKALAKISEFNSEISQK